MIKFKIASYLNVEVQLEVSFEVDEANSLSSLNQTPYFGS
jgi:hypothetical protein